MPASSLNRVESPADVLCVVPIYLEFGTSGAVDNFDAPGDAVTSITKPGATTGVYDIVLSDDYSLPAWTVIMGSTSEVDHRVVFTSYTASTRTIRVTVAVDDGASGVPAAADPADGDIANLVIHCSRASL